MDESWRVPTRCFPSGIASQWSVDCVRFLTTTRFRCGGNAIRVCHAHAISRANYAPSRRGALLPSSTWRTLLKC